MDKTETTQPDSLRRTADTDGATRPAQASGSAERSTNAGEVLQRYLKAQATQISRIIASLNQYRQDLQKLELSLIARIGDVDDDRRRADTRLLRTLQTQRDELDNRLKRHGSLMAMLLLLFSLLVAGTLIFFLLKLNATQQAFETQLTDLKKTLERIDASSPNEPDPQTRLQLDRLSAALAEISKSIERLDEAPPLDLDLRLQPAPNHEPEPPSISLTERETERTPSPQSATELEPTTDTRAPEGTASGSEARDTPTDGADSSPKPEMESSASTPVHPVADSESSRASETTNAAGQAEAVRVKPSASLVTRPVQVGDRPFTVQLIGFHSLEALERFAADHVLPTIYYYRRETYQGRPWFVLIHSLHETREAAEAITARLPPELANLNIWIRKLRPETELTEVRRSGN